MPNNTTNILTIYCENEEVMKKIRDVVLGDNDQVDFNRVIPMPEELGKVHTGGMEIDGAYRNQWLEEKQEDGSIKNIVITEETLNAWKEKHGSTNWYDWSIQNWGTKWNAYENCEILVDDENSLHVEFQTAWSPPVPYYEALGEMFEEAEISAYWNDEGCYERERVY